MKARDIALPLGTGCVGVIAALALVGRPLAAWRLPFMYEEDAVNVLGIAKMGIERGWPSGSDRLGAPGTLDLAYYPMAEQGQLGLMQLLVSGGWDAATSVNAYLFLTFFLAGATATWALRRFGIASALACLGGLTFTLLPCHFWRGTSHMFVSGYYVVPLMTLALLDYRAQGRRLYVYWAFAFLSPLVNTYYTFFFCFLLAALAACDTVAERHMAAFWRATQFACAVGAGFALNMGRSLPLYAQHKLGFARPPQDSEVYGLKLSLMVMPIFSTVSEVVAKTYQTYTHSAPLVTENRMNDLGLIAGCAFLVTLAYGFYMLARPAQTDTRGLDRTLLRRAAMCTILCIALATIGGFLAMFSYLVSPLIRSSNRIEVYIVMLSAVVGLHLLQHAVQHAAQASMAYHTAAVWSVALLLGAVLCWDLDHRPLVPDFAKTDAMYARDAAFFTQLEKLLPPGARVFNLPYVPFPEGGIGAGDYDHLRAFVHTQTLAWSFGAIRNTPVATANRAAEYMLVSGQKAQFVAALKAENFTGILINRQIEALLHRNDEAALIELFGPPALVDDVGEFVFWNAHEIVSG